MNLVRHLILSSSVFISTGLVAANSSPVTAPIKPKKKPVQAQIELLSGYRQDSLHFNFYAATTLPGKVAVNSIPRLYQNNLVLGIKIYEHGYINGMAGYGVLCSSSNKFTTSYPTIPYSMHYHSSTSKGYAADWDVQGGYSFKMFTDYVRLAPELGYTYKRLSVHETCAETFAAPYVGGRLDLLISKNHKVGIYGFYDYYYCASRHDQSYYYNELNNIGGVFPSKVVRGGTLNAYKVGSGVTYKPYKHWTFGLKWNMFHEKSDPLTYLSQSQAYNVTQHMHWTSQELQLSANFLF